MSNHCGVVVAAVLLGASLVVGQEVAPVVTTESRPSADPAPDVEGSAAVQAAEEAASTSPFSGTLSLDFTSQYFGRGIWTEDQGVIFQPNLDLGLKLYEADDGIVTGFGIHAGTFHSVHSGPTGDDGPTHDAWYEADGHAGFSVGLLGFLEVSASYTKYTSPNDGFQDIDELDFGVAVDDSKFWKETMGVNLDGFEGFQPSLTIARELHNQADASPLGSEGTYLELAVDPGFTLVTLGTCPVRLSFPTAVGLSLVDYYEGANGHDSTFGFAQTGLQLAVPLGFIPPSAGSWEYSAGVQFLFLGDTATELNQKGHDFEMILTTGVSVTF